MIDGENILFASFMLERAGVKGQGMLTTFPVRFVLSLSFHLEW